MDGLGAKRSHHVLICNFWEFSLIKTWTVDRNILHLYWLKTTTKRTKIYVQKIWVKNVVVLGLFLFLTGFCAVGIVLWVQVFFDRINGNQH